MALVDDLISAKALIDTPEKWRQDDRVNLAGCCAAISCSRTARATRIGLVASHAEDAMWAALYSALDEEWRDGDELGECIGRFNDDADTTHADILALFDRAISAAKALS